MHIINFSITAPLEKKVDTAIKTHGFSSKAELFRFAMIHYLNELDRGMTVEEEFDYLTSRLAKVAHEKLGRRRLPSMREQM